MAAPLTPLHGTPVGNHCSTPFTNKISVNLGAQKLLKKCCQNEMRKKEKKEDEQKFIFQSKEKERVDWRRIDVSFENEK